WGVAVLAFFPRFASGGIGGAGRGAPRACWRVSGARAREAAAGAGLPGGGGVRDRVRSRRLGSGRPRLEPPQEDAAARSIRLGCRETGGSPRMQCAAGLQLHPAATDADLVAAWVVT